MSYADASSLYTDVLVIDFRPQERSQLVTYRSRGPTEVLANRHEAERVVIFIVEKVCRCDPALGRIGALKIPIGRFNYGQEQALLGFESRTGLFVTQALKKRLHQFATPASDFGSRPPLLILQVL
jgi:hypothetical protein